MSLTRTIRGSVPSTAGTSCNSPALNLRHENRTSKPPACLPRPKPRWSSVSQVKVTRLDGELASLKASLAGPLVKAGGRSAISARRLLRNHSSGLRRGADIVDERLRPADLVVAGARRGAGVRVGDAQQACELVPKVLCGETRVVRGGLLRLQVILDNCLRVEDPCTAAPMA